MGQGLVLRGRSILVPCPIFLVLGAGFAPGGEAPPVAWTRQFPGHSVEEGIGAPLGETSDGGFILSGYSLKKTDGRGEVVWETAFPEPIYPGSSVRQTDDGGYIVGGTFYGPCNSTAFVASQDVALIKIDSQGGIVWEKAFGG